ncbi:MAG: hypothetical protein IOB09_03310, partial [Burkholderia sp.]|nr:hypothetical protein [Burkholderia sp.]
GEYGLWRIETGREASGVLGVSVRWDGHPGRPASRVEILLPASLQGPVAVRGARAEQDTLEGAWRRLVVTFDN